MGIQEPKPDNFVGQIITCFGGLSQMAGKTGLNEKDILSWESTGMIPRRYFKDIKNAAMLHHVDTGNLLQEDYFAPDVQEPLPADRPTEFKSPKQFPLMFTAGVVIFAAAAIGVVVAISPQVRNLGENSSKRVIDAPLPVSVANAPAPIQPGAAPSELEKQFAMLKDKMGVLEAQAQHYATKADIATSGQISSRMNTLETRVEHLWEGSKAKGLQAMATRLDVLQNDPAMVNNMQAVTQKILSADSLDTVDSPAGSDLDALTVKLQTLRENDPDVAATFDGVAPEDMRAAVMLVGLSQLRNSLSRDNQSFDDDLRLLQMTGGKDDPVLQESISRLAPLAKQGVLTPKGLSQQLRDNAGAIVKASLTNKETTLKEKAVARLGDMVVIEKDGTRVNGTPTQKKIAEAQRLIDNGDLRGAVTVLNSLEGEAALTAKPIVTNIQSTLSVQDIQDSIKRSVTSKINSTVGAGASYTTNGGGAVGTIKEVVPEQFHKLQNAITP